MNEQLEAGKGLKRKQSQDQDEKSVTSEKKRKKKDGSSGGGAGVRPKHCPLSERQQLALLMQMTAEENNERSSPPPPNSRKTPGSSGRKDKVNKRNERGETPLHLATIRGDLPSIIDLIKQGADINVQDYAGWTPLHEACNHQHPHIAKYLLESGANVNSKGFENDYPLHDAVSNNHHDLVELLLKHGANPLLPNKAGERPLDLSESEVITKMMQREIISSDDSDREKSAQHKLSQDKMKWRARSGSESDPSVKSAKVLTASRQLFKSEKKLKRRTKTVSSSFESDDSDDLPLSRQLQPVIPKHFSSSSSSNYEVGNKSKVVRAGDSGTKKPRKRVKKKKKSFMPNTPESSDDCSTDSEKTSKRLPSSVQKNKRRSSISSDDDLPLQLPKPKPAPPLFEVPYPSLSSISTTSAGTVPVSTVASRTSEADVYDLTDDFSNESEMISLKPEHSLFSRKWESPVKTGGIKTPSLFTRKPLITPVKVRKASRDSDSSLTFKQAKPAESKTVTIRPVISSPSYQRSEMLFDKLFKSPPKEQERQKPEKPFKDFETKEKAHTQFGSIKFETHLPTSFGTFQPTSTVVVSTSSDSIASIKAPVLSCTTTFSTATITSAVEVKVSVLASRLEAAKTPHVIIKSDDSELRNKKRKSTDSEQVVEEKAQSLTSAKKELTNPIRSVSLDNSSTPAKVPVHELDKTPKFEKAIENKAVKRIAHSESTKEKVSKTLSEPGKITPKSVTKSHSTETKRPTPKPVVKKDTKPEPKKLQLLSDDASGFFNDIESLSRQRELQKLKQKKKQLQKRTKSSPGAKPEEKKVSKRPEVALSGATWLDTATTPERTKQRKASVQKSVKKEQIEVLNPQTGATESLPVSHASHEYIDSSGPKSDPSLYHAIVPFAATPEQHRHESELNLPNVSHPYSTHSTPNSLPPQQQVPFHSVANVQEMQQQQQQLQKQQEQLQQQLQPQPQQQQQSQQQQKHHHQIQQQPVAFQATPYSTAGIPLHHAVPVQSSQPQPYPHVSAAALPNSQPKVVETNVSTLKPSITPVLPQHNLLPVVTSTSTEVLVESGQEDLTTETTTSTALPTNPLPLADSDVTPEAKLADLEQETDPDPEKPEHIQEQETTKEEDQLSESQRMLQEYIQQRLSMATVCFESTEPKRLPVYIPMSQLQGSAKNPLNDKLNAYEERFFIQKLAYEKRRRLANVVPQAPQYYWEYMTFTGGYLLSGRKESQLSVPVLAPPPHLCDPMVDLFTQHEEQRVRLRVQHAIEREKLIISCEQEIMREHCRAARTIQNQQVPYSACAVLMDNEVYNLPRNNNDNEPPGKPSIRDRFNARLFISWLQDVDDKYEKMKSSLLTRQKHEAEAMYAMQKTEWYLKLQELDPSQRALTISDVNELHVPMVNIAGDFDLLPA